MRGKRERERGKRNKLGNRGKRMEENGRQGQRRMGGGAGGRGGEEEEMRVEEGEKGRKKEGEAMSIFSPQGVRSMIYKALINVKDFPLVGLQTRGPDYRLRLQYQTFS